jgi:hypothetical protein
MEEVFDIGGVYQLVLIKGSNGYHGHYKVYRSGMTFTYDGTGLSKKQIITQFWNNAKRVTAQIA